MYCLTLIYATMNQSSVNMFLAINSDKFPSNSLFLLQDMLAGVSPENEHRIMSATFKDPMTAFVLSIFLGFFSIDRFYLGQIGIGFLKLICNILFLGLWTLIDWFMIINVTRKSNMKLLHEMCQYAHETRPTLTQYNPTTPMQHRQKHD